VDPGRWPISAKIIRLWSGPGGGQPWVAAGLNPRIAEPTRPPNPNGVDLAEGRPLQGRSHFSPSISVGFTYGYSRFPASRDGTRRIDNALILMLMGRWPTGANLNPRGGQESAQSRKAEGHNAWFRRAKLWSALGMLKWHDRRGAKCQEHATL
jgi:hypothetical protein